MSQTQKEILIKRVSLLLMIYSFIVAFSYIGSSRAQQNTNDDFPGSHIKPAPEGVYVDKAQFNEDVLHYTIRVRLNTEEKIVYGNVSLSLKFIDQPAEAVYLNLFDNMSVDSLFLNGQSNSFAHLGKRLTIPLQHKFQPGDTFSVRIVYHGTPRNLGYSSFKFGEINGNPLVGTLNEPEFASTWFPCNDRPDDKALLDIYITGDSSLTSVSNGYLAEIIPERGLKTYHWKTVYPISTYLICLYSSVYQMFQDTCVLASGDTIPLYFYAIPKHLERAKTDFQDHQDMLNFYSNLFGPYPFPKEKYGVAEFLWQGGAMEHQTITGVGTNFVRGARQLTDMLAHELVHHWWGDCVGPKTWKDIWLNEGFATYSEILYAEHVDPDMSAGKRLSAFRIAPFTDDVYNPQRDMFSASVYYKGAWILHMLRSEIGDSTFFTLLRTWFTTYKYSNASTSDFIGLAERLSGKNLQQFFKQWLFDGRGKLRVEYTWKTKPTDEGILLMLTLRQTQEGYDAYQVPVDVYFEQETKLTSFTKTIRLEQKEQTFQFTLKKRPNSLQFDQDCKLLGEFIDRNPYE